MDFLERVGSYLGAAWLTPECGEHHEHCLEFSNHGCDSCGFKGGADLHYATAYIDGETHEYQICEDCVLFHANGDLPEGQ